MTSPNKDDIRLVFWANMFWNGIRGESKDFTLQWTEEISYKVKISIKMINLVTVNLSFISIQNTCSNLIRIKCASLQFHFLFISKLKKNVTSNKFTMDATSIVLLALETLLQNNRSTIFTNKHFLHYHQQHQHDRGHLAYSVNIFHPNTTT